MHNPLRVEWPSTFRGDKKVSFFTDVNECLIDNGGCEGLCVNTLGSYKCHCPGGFKIDGNKCIGEYQLSCSTGVTRSNIYTVFCIYLYWNLLFGDENKLALDCSDSFSDINECLLRNGHGPCQDKCVNHWGSYKCSCEDIPGTRLAQDGHTCEDIDECKEQTAGCSHECINTVGSAFCLCPKGFMLGMDWKTCHDVDECAMEEMQETRCEHRCENTIGSYVCLNWTRPVEVFCWLEEIHVLFFLVTLCITFFILFNAQPWNMVGRDITTGVQECQGTHSIVIGHPQRRR